MGRIADENDSTTRPLVGAEIAEVDRSHLLRLGKLAQDPRDEPAESCEAARPRCSSGAASAPARPPFWLDDACGAYDELESVAGH